LDRAPGYTESACFADVDVCSGEGKERVEGEDGKI
jgi:hypothetical protein